MKSFLNRHSLVIAAVVVIILAGTERLSRTREKQIQ